MSKMKLLSTKQVAERLGVTDRTVARWCRDKKYFDAVKVGRVWRIRSNDTGLMFLIGETW